MITHLNETNNKFIEKDGFVDIIDLIKTYVSDTMDRTSVKIY